MNIQEKNEKNGFDADAALALMMDAQLSKRQYETIRAAIKKIGFDIFPSYKKILESKKNAILKILTLQRVQHQMIYRSY